MQPAATSRQYFLGINGEQTGPFSEREIVAKIRQKLVPADALVWYEGLPDWQPVTSLPAFESAFSSDDTGAVSDLTGDVAADPAEKLSTTGPRGPVKKKAKKHKDDDALPTFASGGDAAPVFNNGIGARMAGFVRRRLGILIVVFLVGAAGVAGYYVVMPMLEESGDIPAVPLPRDGKPKRASKLPPNTNKSLTANKPGQVPAPGTATNAAAAPTAVPLNTAARQASLRQAQSELLLKPESSLTALKKIIEESATDDIGKEAVEVALGYYRQNQRPADAGRVLLIAKRPLEAAKYFLMEPPEYDEAERALFTAYQASTDPARREILVQDIELLLGPVGNPALGEERIRLLEKDFPGQKHPYGYYLKSPDEKITDLFARISFHFVQTLLLHINTEFPALSLVGRPLVEVVKSRDGTYRLVGRYKGDVILNRDRLNDISFVFWLTADQWTLVDTDVTAERGKFARKERDRLKDKPYDAASLLEYLQAIFRQKFPKSGLHEQVTAKDIVPAKNAVE